MKYLANIGKQRFVQNAHARLLLRELLLLLVCIS